MKGNPSSIDPAPPQGTKEQRHVLPYEQAETLDVWLRRYEFAKEREFIRRIDWCLPRGLNRLLDIGCGTGLHTMLWSKRGKEVTAADFSTVFRDYIQRTYRFPFIWTDVLNCTISERYDICFCMALATLLVDQDSRFRTFETLSRLVRPGGYLVLITNSNQWPFARKVPREARLHCLDEEDLQRVREALFEVQKVFYWSSTPRRWWRRSLTRGVAKAMEKMATNLGIGARKVVICQRRPFEGQARAGIEGL